MTDPLAPEASAPFPGEASAPAGRPQCPALRYTKAIGLGLGTALVLNGLGAFVLTSFEFNLSRDFAAAVSIRILGALAAGFVAGLVAGRHETAIGFATGALTAVPSIVAGFESPAVDGLEMALWSATGGLGGVLRWVFRSGHHRHAAFRVPVGGILILAGLPLMAAFAVSHMMFVTQVLSRRTDGVRLPFPMVFSFIVLGTAGAVMFMVGIRLVRAPADRILAKARASSILLLRSFKDDDMPIPEEEAQRGFLEKAFVESEVTRSMFRGFGLIRELSRDSTFEGQLIKALKRHLRLPVIAVAKPGQMLPPAAGASRYAIPHDDWQGELIRLMSDCRLLVMVAGHSTGVAWELQEIFRRDLQERLLVVVPPVLPETVAERWEKIRSAVMQVTGNAAGLPEELPEGTRFLVFSRKGEARCYRDERDTEEGYRPTLLAALSSLQTAFTPTDPEPPAS